MAELRLFGPVQLWAGDRLVDLGSPKQRTVLAALAVDLGQVVTVDTLIDRVWGEQTPADPRAVLYGYLTRTRRALAAGGDPADDVPRLLRRPAGYLLEFDPDRVDLHRFGRLTRRARDPQCGEPERLELLREALSLWRGEPLAGLPGGWADRVRRGWRQRRIDAVTAWAGAEVAAGDPGTVIGPVTELLDQDPLVEPLLAVLMRALHSTGRAAEALRWFAVLRKRLAEELGADPGAELEQLHLSILRSDLPVPARARSATPPAAGSAGSPAVPAQLPADLPGLVGRRDLLARLDAILASPGQPAAVVISALSGTAGVGKTTLAVHWAHRVADRFPDGQLYVNLRGFDPGGAAIDPAEAVRGFLDALGVPPQQVPASLAAQTGRYRSLVAGKRMLIVLDNARDADQVRPLLPGSPGCLVVVTSRNQLAGLVAAEAAQPVLLDLLRPDEARELLANRLGADRVAAEPEAVDEIIVRCARLPLALAVVAARAAAHPDFPLRALAGELHQALDALTAGDPASDVRAVFSWSYQALRSDAGRVFRLLGRHPGPDVTAPAVAGLAGLPVQQVRPLLAELTRAHLVTEHTPGRYAFHDLLRAYATELAHRDDPADERRAALGRVLDHYLRTADVANLLLHPRQDRIPLAAALPGVTPEALSDQTQAIGWFAAEHRVLLAAVEAAAANEFHTHAWQLAWFLSRFFRRTGHWQDWVACQSTALAAARRTGDRVGQAHSHRGLGTAYGMLGQYDDADRHLWQAADLFAAVGDRSFLPHTHLDRARVHSLQRQYVEAIHHAEQALEQFQAGSDRRGQANALNNLGWYHTQLGDHQQALSYGERALALLEEIGDQRAEADTWDTVGYAYHQLGQYQQAIACYQRAVELYRGTSFRSDQAEILVHLGDTYGAAGEPVASRRAWQEALAILDELDHPDADQVRGKLRALDQPPSG